MLKKSVVLAVFLNVVFAGVAFSLPLGADLIDFNGLKWLSPVHSAGIETYKMVDYLADPASDYYGLRHATRYELDELARAFDSMFNLTSLKLRPSISTTNFHRFTNYSA